MTVAASVNTNLATRRFFWDCTVEKEQQNNGYSIGQHERSQLGWGMVTLAAEIYIHTSGSSTALSSLLAEQYVLVLRVAYSINR